MPENKETLKVCPLCGADAIQHEPTGLVRCSDDISCYLSTRFCAMAVNKWNTRPGELALQAEVDRLKDTIGQGLILEGQQKAKIDALVIAAKGFKNWYCLNECKSLVSCGGEEYCGKIREIRAAIKAGGRGYEPDNRPQS